ncbi:DUF6054 family protein [Proteiniclasticum sp. C24MP]|uniref:DUF6054 family protein n=1 Tax=Proteiniclasticum sp. C24MP TaxID=3374101 RepID=UPI003754FC9A
MAKLSMQGKGNGEEIVNFIIEEMGRSGMTVELIDSVTRQIGNAMVYIMVFEKYYMRSSNRASLTVVVTAENDAIIVDAIGAGGGQGVVFKWSWGAEESFVSSIENILAGKNFILME